MSAKPTLKSKAKAADTGAAAGFSAAGLGDAVLEAASSRGLLRRAARDVAAGLARRTSGEGGTEVLSVDGETVRLGSGGLAAAACTCPSRELCRHVLAAVLLLRDGPPGAAAAPAPGAAPQGSALPGDPAVPSAPALDAGPAAPLAAPAGAATQGQSPAGDAAVPGATALGAGPPAAPPGWAGPDTFPAAPTRDDVPPGDGGVQNGSAAALGGTGADDAAALSGPLPPAPDAAAEIAGLGAAALVAAFGRAALRRAEALLAAAAVPGDPAAGLQVAAAGLGCTIAIAGHPLVHYVAGQGPAGMVSKAADPKALHAAALLAVRRLRAGQPAAADAGPASAAPAARPKGEAAFLDGVADALRDAARSALASAPAALEDRLLDLAVSSRADALPNLAGALRGIAGDMAARRARAAGQDPFAALAAIARAYALTQALRQDGEDPRLRGEVRGAFAPRPALDLVGCGVELWRTDGGARGVTAHFVAPAAEGGPHPFSATLARAAGQDLQFTPVQAAMSEVVWGRTLAQLGAEAFHLPEPAADPEGRLSPRAGASAVRAGIAQANTAQADTGWAEAVGRHPGLVVQEWGELAARLAGSFAPTLRRQGAGAQPLLLRPSALGTPGFDAVAQAAILPVRDAGGAWLELRVGGDDRMDDHLNLLAALPDGGAGCILAVLARVDAGEVALSPIAACAGAGQPLRHLDLAPPRKAAPAAPEGVLSRLRQGLALVGWPSLGRSAPQRFVRAAPPAGATARLLDAAADEALALAELGGRMEDPERLDRLRGMARLAEAGGLPVLGYLLRRLADSPGADRPHHLLAFTHALACWRRLAPTLPMLLPAA
ncbi:MAG: SWIM zinc finger family protein [Janthinobacterium lividum]